MEVPDSLARAVSKMDQRQNVVVVYLLRSWYISNDTNTVRNPTLRVTACFNYLAGGV